MEIYALLYRRYGILEWKILGLNLWNSLSKKSDSNHYFGVWWIPLYNLGVEGLKLVIPDNYYDLQKSIEWISTLGDSACVKSIILFYCTPVQLYSPWLHAHGWKEHFHQRRHDNHHWERDWLKVEKVKRDWSNLLQWGKKWGCISIQVFPPSKEEIPPPPPPIPRNFTPGCTVLYTRC